MEEWLEECPQEELWARHRSGVARFCLGPRPRPLHECERGKPALDCGEIEKRRSKKLRNQSRAHRTGSAKVVERLRGIDQTPTGKIQQRSKRFPFMPDRTLRP